jgi:hypothetical protein
VFILVPLALALYGECSIFRRGMRQVWLSVVMTTPFRLSASASALPCGYILSLLYRVHLARVPL